MLVIIVWILSGVVCALIAGPKNRSVLSWFVGGCLFGVFAIIAAALVPPLPSQEI